MHYEIDYAKIGADEEERDDKAINDLAEWLGNDRWQVLLNAPNDPSSFSSKNNIRFVLDCICGVSGRPVEAYIRRYFADLPESLAPESEEDGA